jgi:hypothetical protein
MEVFGAVQVIMEKIMELGGDMVNGEWTMVNKEELLSTKL